MNHSRCKSPILLVRGCKLQPQDQIWPTTCLVSKALLKHISSHLFAYCNMQWHIIWDGFLGNHQSLCRVSIHDRDLLVYKAKNNAIWPFCSWWFTSENNEHQAIQLVLELSSSFVSNRIAQFYAYYEATGIFIHIQIMTSYCMLISNVLYLHKWKNIPLQKFFNMCMWKKWRFFPSQISFCISFPGLP